MEEWNTLPPPSVPPPPSTPCSLCSIPRSAGLLSSLGRDKVKRQCSIIFLVLKLLKIPLPECQELLRNYGDPEEWIDLCPTCTSILNEALDLNDEINRMRRKIEELGEKLTLPLHIKLEGEEEVEILPTSSSSSAARYIRRIVFNRGVLQRQCQSSTDSDSGFGFTEAEAPVDLEEEGHNLSGLDHFFPLSPFHNFTAEGEEEDSESDNSRDEDYVFPEATKIESEEEEKKEVKVKMGTRKSKPSSLTLSVPVPHRKNKGTGGGKRLGRKKGDSRSKAAKTSTIIKEESNDSVNTTVNSDHVGVGTIPVRRYRRLEGSRTFQCNIDGCSHKVQTQTEWILHKYREHAVGLPCDKCGRSSKSLIDLENHVRKMHYDENEKKTIFACPGCGEWWHGDINEFQQHLGKPDCKPECKEKTIPCSQCRWRFENQTTLDLHMKIKHLVTQAPIACPHPQCGTSFKRKTTAYYAHVKSHTQDISQICHLCGKLYPNHRCLRRHVAETHGNRVHKCDQCGQTFKRKTHLERHKTLHTDVFPYLCTLCGKRFRMTNQLTVHMWSHDPDRKEKYSTYKPKPKGYKPMREKRKRFRPTGVPPEEIQERQSSKNKSTDSSTSSSRTDISVHESFITNPVSVNSHPPMLISGFLPIPTVGPLQPQDIIMKDFC